MSDRTAVLIAEARDYAGRDDTPATASSFIESLCLAVQAVQQETAERCAMIAEQQKRPGENDWVRGQTLAASEAAYFIRAAFPSNDKEPK